MTLMDVQPERKENGRFLPGNKGGPGPGSELARRVQTLKHAMLRAETPERVAKVMEAMYQKASAGDVAAAHVYFDRLLGKVTDETSKDERTQLVQMFLTQVNHTHVIAPPGAHPAPPMLDVTPNAPSAAGSKGTHAQGDSAGAANDTQGQGDATGAKGEGMHTHHAQSEPANSDPEHE